MWGHDAGQDFGASKKTLWLNMEGQIEQKESNIISDIDNRRL